MRLDNNLFYKSVDLGTSTLTISPLSPGLQRLKNIQKLKLIASILQLPMGEDTHVKLPE